MKISNQVTCEEVANQLVLREVQFGCSKTRKML